MASSIYNIPDWTIDTFYSLHDIVKVGLLYYYSTRDHPGSAVVLPEGFASDLRDGKWTGRDSLSDSVDRPLFSWTPSYSMVVNVAPKLREIKFGEGYQQTLADGINNILLTLNLRFDGRSSAENCAILHFLFNQGGKTSFIYTAPPPHNIQKLWKCKNWSSNEVFYENYNINCEFVEFTN
jgi:phage-related protein